MQTEDEPITTAEDAKESNTLRVIGWFSVGMAVAAVGIFGVMANLVGERTRGRRGHLCRPRNPQPIQV